jgi:signal transduction histidine kinase
MNDHPLESIMSALNLAAFARESDGQFRLLAPPPAWVNALWPDLVGSGDFLQPRTSPFLENFLIDAVEAWAADSAPPVKSGPWLEADTAGRNCHLQATAFRAAGRPILVVEELGSAFTERTRMVQKAHEAALAYERLQRAEQALSEQKDLLERRVQERTAELSRSNTALREEIALRQRYAERLESMHEIDKAILAAQSPEAIAEAALRRMYPLLPCEHACVLELDRESGHAMVLASVDRGQLTGAERWQVSGEQLLEARVLRSGQMHRASHVPNRFDVPSTGAPDRIWDLVVDLPLVAEDAVIGILNLAAHSGADFTPEHEAIAQDVAAQLAVALRQARLFALLSAGRQRLRALSLRLLEAQEAERRSIAHELHDEIGQILTGLKVTLKAAAGDATVCAGNLAQALIMVDDLLNRIRRLSLDLRPQLLDDLGLMPALDWLFKRFYNQTGLQIQFKHTLITGRLPTQLETAVFRIVQEALTNVTRHAAVQDATVRLWSSAGSVGVQVEDQGRGFDLHRVLADRNTVGLAGMRERALMLGGSLTVDSAPSGGTRVTVELPLDVEARLPLQPEADL